MERMLLFCLRVQLRLRDITAAFVGRIEPESRWMLWGVYLFLTFWTFMCTVNVGFSVKILMHACINKQTNKKQKLTCGMCHHLPAHIIFSFFFFFGHVNTTGPLSRSDSLRLSYPKWNWTVSGNRSLELIYSANAQVTTGVCDLIPAESFAVLQKTDTLNAFFCP